MEWCMLGAWSGSNQIGREVADAEQQRMERLVVSPVGSQTAVFTAASG